MGIAMELITGRTTHPAAVETDLTMNTGNSLTVRAAKEGSKISIINIFAKTQSAGTFKVLSPKMHDNVQNIRFNTIALDSNDLMPYEFKQEVYSQDILRCILSCAGDAVGDIEFGNLILHYDDLDGVSANLLAWDDVKDRIRNFLTVTTTHNFGVTGDYSGEVSLNSTYDLMKGNTEYALLGYICSGLCDCIRWRGSDTGNLGVGGPGYIKFVGDTRDWFIKISKATGLSTIPIFNSANKASIFVDGVQDENAAALTVNSIFAELS